MQLKNLRPLCFLWFDRKLSPTWVVYICFTTGRRWISKKRRFFFWLKQWLFVFYTNAQVCFYSAERVFTACSRPTKGHVVPQILQPLQGKCVSWLNQQHQAQMIAPPEGWRLIDWFFFFFPWKQYQLVNPKWTQAFPALVMVDRCGCQKAHIIFSNDVARLTDSNCIHVLRKDTATGDYNLFLMELFLDFAVNIYI